MSLETMVDQTTLSQVKMVLLTGVFITEVYRIIIIEALVANVGPQRSMDAI